MPSAAKHPRMALWASPRRSWKLKYDSILGAQGELESLPCQTGEVAAVSPRPGSLPSRSGEVVVGGSG